MVRPTDQKMTAIKNIVYYTYRSQEKEACYAIVDHTGKHQDSQEAEGVGRKVSKSRYCGFHGKKQRDITSRFRIG